MRNITASYTNFMKQLIIIQSFVVLLKNKTLNEFSYYGFIGVVVNNYVFHLKYIKVVELLIFLCCNYLFYLNRTF